MIGRFRLGVSSFVEGVKTLKNDKNIMLLGLIPAVMSLTLYTVGLIIGVSYVDDVLNWIIKTNISDYNIFIKSLIYILSFLFLGFILYFITFIVVSILAVPVCTVLSERVMIKSGYLTVTKKGLKESAFTFVRMLRISLLKLGFLVIISGLIFLASLIPVIAPLALYFSVMILTFDCMDYAMEHDEQGLRARFKFLFQHWVEFSGFALCMAIILAIPFIHFILLPSAVLGTSILYSRIQTTKRLQGKI